jgi:hypothetical protein
VQLEQRAAKVEAFAAVADARVVLGETDNGGLDSDALKGEIAEKLSCGEVGDLGGFRW